MNYQKNLVIFVFYKFFFYVLIFYEKKINNHYFINFMFNNGFKVIK